MLPVAVIFDFSHKNRENAQKETLKFYCLAKEIFGKAIALNEDVVYNKIELKSSLMPIFNYNMSKMWQKDERFTGGMMTPPPVAEKGGIMT